MKIYHYTTIETLALIIKSRAIRFNRLDCVDDLEESLYGSGNMNIKLSQYEFVSCWTKDKEENLALWKMYTNNKGVRICMDDDFLITVHIGFNSRVPNRKGVIRTPILRDGFPFSLC